MIEELRSVLKKAGYSLTRPRLTVFSDLQGTKPKTMPELVTSLKDVIDRASIYRTVALYEKLGIVNRVQHGWKYRIELSDAFTPHHHHLTCTNCQRVISFDEPNGFGELTDSITATNGFVPTSHSLEIYGICPECNTAKKQKRAV